MQKDRLVNDLREGIHAIAVNDEYEEKAYYTLMDFIYNIIKNIEKGDYDE